MNRQNQYVLLIASLPPLGELFEADRTPISPIMLSERLKLMREDHLDRLYKIVDLVSWSRLPMGISDKDIIEGANQFYKSERRPLLRKIVESRMELHTISSALRQKMQGAMGPPKHRPWGYGPWTPHIERHWMEPYFGLDGVFPWIKDAEDLLKSESCLEMEKHMLKVAWDMLSFMETGHYFDFEAVALYVLKWDIIKRWTHYDGPRAVTRFNELTIAGIGTKYVDKFKEG